MNNAGGKSRDGEFVKRSKKFSEKREKVTRVEGKENWGVERGKGLMNGLECIWKTKIW